MTRLLALLLLSCGATAPIAEAPNLGTTVAAASVMLVNDGKQPKCGGVAVGPHSLLTALHCLQNESMVEYVDYRAWKFGWRQDTAVLAMQNPAKDLVLLATSEPLDAWAVPAFRSLENGEQVCWSHRFSLECGRVVDASAHTQTDNALYLEVTDTNLPGVPGVSGNGVWDVYGRLVGIDVAARKANNHALFIRPDAIVELLTEGR